MSVSLQQLKVADIMTPNPMRLDEETPLEEIFALFSTHGLNCLPVVNSQGCLEGCITITDLEKSRQLFDLKEYISIIMAGLEPDLRSRISQNFSLDGPIDLRAREVMSVRTPKVLPTDSVATLCQRLLEFRGHYAMVVDETDKVVGMVSTHDILKHLAQNG